MKKFCLAVVMSWLPLQPAHAQMDNVLRCYRTCCDFSRDTSAVNGDAGNLIRKGNYFEAYSALNRVLRCNNSLSSIERADLMNMRGSILLEIGELKSARQEFRRASYIRGTKNMSRTLSPEIEAVIDKSRKIRDHSRAVTLLSEALNRPNLNAHERSRLYQLQGASYYELNDDAQTVASFEATIDAGGLNTEENKDLRINIAQLYIGMGFYEKGAHMLKEYTTGFDDFIGLLRLHRYGHHHF